MVIICSKNYCQSPLTVNLNKAKLKHTNKLFCSNEYVSLFEQKNASTFKILSGTTVPNSTFKSLIENASESIEEISENNNEDTSESHTTSDFLIPVKDMDESRARPNKTGNQNFFENYPKRKHGSMFYYKLYKNNQIENTTEAVIPVVPNVKIKKSLSKKESTKSTQSKENDIINNRPMKKGKPPKSYPSLITGNEVIKELIKLRNLLNMSSYVPHVKKTRRPTIEAIKSAIVNEKRILKKKEVSETSTLKNDAATSTTNIEKKRKPSKSKVIKKR